jgi:hypothetical protein
LNTLAERTSCSQVGTPTLLAEPTIKTIAAERRKTPAQVAMGGTVILTPLSLFSMENH